MLLLRKKIKIIYYCNIGSQKHNQCFKILDVGYEVQSANILNFDPAPLSLASCQTRPLTKYVRYVTSNENI